VPLALPVQATYQRQLDVLRWQAQGIDTGKVDKYVTAKTTSLKGKNIKDFLKIILQQTTTNNALFSDPNTVAQWDNAMNRISVMGDISDELTKTQTSDLMISTTATSLNSIYVALNDVTQNLMFEFYQDRDGIIRIKPPYWSEGVLRDHVIDPIMIVSVNESTDFSNLYTRTVVTGNLEDEVMTNSPTAAEMFTPAAVFVGDLTDSKKAIFTSSRDVG